MKKEVLSILERIEEDKLENNNSFWNISWETGEYLQKIIKDNDLKSGLEIGGSNGFSALFLASALEENNGNLTTTESSPKRLSILKQNILDSKLDNIRVLEGHAPEILEEIDQKLDFVFIDATKYEYIQYIKFLLDGKLKENTVIIADNISSHKEALQEYIDFVSNEKMFKTKFIDIGTGLLKSKCF